MSFIIDTFELHRTDKIDAGRTVFYGGGVGQRKVKFIAWASCTSYYSVRKDWHNEYFAFSDKADEDKFVKKYAGYLTIPP